MCCSVVLRVSGGWFPVEDSVWLHRMLGTAMLTALFVAPLLWIIAMGASCYGTATDSVSDLFCIMGPIYYSQRRDLKHQPLPARIIPTVIICTAIPIHTHAQAAHASTQLMKQFHTQELAQAKACTAFAPPIIDAKKEPLPQANNVSKHIIITDLL